MSKRFLSGYRRGSPSDAAGNKLNHNARELPGASNLELRPTIDELPASASRLPNLPFRLYLSNTASLDPPLDARREPPGQTTLPSNLLLDEAYPSDTAILKPQSDVGESLWDRQTFLFHPAAGRPTQPRCRLTARPSDPLNFALLSKHIRLGEPRSPDGRRREHSRPENLIFSSPRSTRLTRPTRRF